MSSLSELTSKFSKIASPVTCDSVPMAQIYYILSLNFSYGHVGHEVGLAPGSVVLYFVSKLLIWACWA